MKLEQLPRNLQILLGDNISEITISPEKDLKFINPEWVDGPPLKFPVELIPIPEPKIDDRLLEYLRGEVPTAPVVQPKVYKFYYDRAVYNPYAVNKNLMDAINLHADCIELRKQVRNIRLKQKVEDDQYELEKKLEEFASQELELIRMRSTNISYAKKLQTNEGETTGTFDEEATEKEIALAQSVKEITNKFREKIRQEKRTITSLYSDQIDLQRAEIKYWYKFTELVMLLQAIKHGLYLIFGMEPKHNADILKQLEKQEIKDNLEELTIRDYIEPKRFLFEYEDLIRDYLWGTIKQLKAIQLDSYETVLVSQVRASKMVEQFHWVDIIPFNSDGGAINEFEKEKAKATWVKDHWADGDLEFEFNPAGNFRSIRFKGIFLEINLKEVRQNKKFGKLKRPYDPNKNYETVELKDYLRYTLPAELTPPLQQLEAQEDYTNRSNKSFVFNVPLVTSRSSGFLKGAAPIFYGGDVIRNINPVGKWRLKLHDDQLLKTIVDDVDLVTVYINVEITRD